MTTETLPAERLELLTGAEAVVEAMRQIDPDVVPIYPITPQTPIIQGFAKVVADGRAQGELINVESEHSAMSAAVGAALAGARTMTATSSQGLALMAEIVYIAASMRAPIVIALGNRALSGPINIHGDHSDAMLVRDSGCIQLFAESAQEVYDLMVAAPRVAEHPDVLLPVFVCQDGFAITHSAEPVGLLPDETVARFVGNYRIPFSLLDLDRPTTQGPFAMPDYYFELKRAQGAAMETALTMIDEVAAALETVTGRDVGALEAYRLEDAATAVVVMGSAAGTAKDAVDALRDDGVRAGLLKVRSFRPFPGERVRAALRRAARVAVLDRAEAPGGTRPLHADVAAALYGTGPALEGHVYGLGGRDLHPEDVCDVLLGHARTAIGLRESHEPPQEPRP